MEDNFEKMLSSIMGNNELIEKISKIASSHNGDKESALPDVIEAISSSVNSNQNEQDNKSQSVDTGNTIEKDEIENKLKGISNFSRNSKLLIALKPYLSDKRAQMIDNLMKFEQIAEIMKIAR